MRSQLLSKEQIYTLVQENKYEASEEKLSSRCIDGRYENTSSLPALAIPGGDAGQLVALYASGMRFGFEVDQEKALETLVALVGGIKYFSFHTDSHNHSPDPLAGDGHFRAIHENPENYGLDAQTLTLVTKQIKNLIAKGAQETVLQGDHKEGALLQLKGNYGVLPRFYTAANGAEALVEVFVYHETLAAKRNRLFAEALIKRQAVILTEGLDAEYLYEVISETLEDHLAETVKKLSPGLPIYLVEFATDGGFELTEMGNT